jgi:translation elongation factor EF-4
VIAYVRVVDGTFTKGEAIRAMQAGTEAEIDDIGFFNAEMTRPTSSGRRGRLPDHRLKDVTSCASATR